MNKKRFLQNILSVGIVILIVSLVFIFNFKIGFTVFENIELVPLFLFLILISIIIIIVIIILMILYKNKGKEVKDDAKK